MIIIVIGVLGTFGVHHCSTSRTAAAARYFPVRSSLQNGVRVLNVICLNVPVYYTSIYTVCSLPIYFMETRSYYNIIIIRIINISHASIIIT